MRNKFLAIATLACSALAVAAAPISADAQDPAPRPGLQATKHAKNTGTVIGAVGGGVLGNVVSAARRAAR